MKKFSNTIILIFFVSVLFSCAGRSPIKKHNNKFLAEYGRDIKKLKDKHNKIEEQNGRVSYTDKKYEAKMLCGTEEIKAGNCYYNKKEKKYYQDTNFERYPLPKDKQVVENQELKEDYLEKNNVLLEQNKKIYYLSANSGKFSESTIVKFDDIEIPRYKQYSSITSGGTIVDLGPKDYEYVNNIELQESVDYLSVINKTRAKKRRELVIQQRKKEREETLAAKVQESSEDVKRTFGDLFKKFFGKENPEKQAIEIIE
ncbi:hypothetical protein ACFL0U_00805 [Pseudomonadota bacterium]